VAGIKCKKARKAFVHNALNTSPDNLPKRLAQLFKENGF
jgi:hypothetical protein